MKIKIFQCFALTTALLLTSGCAWELTGNAGTDPGRDFLGTTDNQPLVIKTNNNAVLHIDVAGNVGIGTAGPAEKLSVAGTVESSTGGFRFPDGSIQTTAATVSSASVTTRSSTATVGPLTCCTSATASCNSDEIATGGGFARDADDPSLEVRYSRPSTNGWTAQMTNYGPAQRSLTVYAVCLKLQ